MIYRLIDWRSMWLATWLLPALGLVVGVLVDEWTTPEVQIYLRHALHAHNGNASTGRQSVPASRYFKLDEYEKLVDSANSHQLTVARQFIYSAINLS